MDIKLGNYFCIFCNFKCNDIETVYNHYERHMRLSDFCKRCDNPSGILSNTIDYTKHCKQSNISQREQEMINMWIKRFLDYQSSILDKTYSEIISSKHNPMFYKCPVCQYFMRSYRQYLKSDIELLFSKIIWTTNPSKRNMWRHSFFHLRYLPYLCLVCDKEGRFHNKCDFTQMSRHFKSNHSTTLSRKISFDGMIEHAKINKIESFVDFCYNINKLQLNTRTGRINSLNKSYEKDFADFIDMIKKADNKTSKPNTTIESNSDVVSYRVIQPILDNFAVKHKEDYYNVKKNFKLKNYFCIFCNQTFYDEKTALRHYMRHIDYYPIACLNCNERLTDLRSFVTHHKNVHSKYDKGKFKKKEQLELDTWIKSFLLLQTTITASASNQQSLPPQPSHLKKASCLNCPVCIKLIEMENNVEIRELIVNPRHHDDTSLSNHIQQHLVYYPFECVLCKAKGKSVRVTCRDSVAVDHLNEHQLDICTAQLDKYLTEYFPKTLSIPKIEDMIKTFIVVAYKK